MIGSPIPSKLKELFERETYGERWYHPIIGFPLIIVIWIVWYLIVIPWRRIGK